MASLFRLALRWYGWAGVLMVTIVLPAGLIFFTHYRPPDVHVNWVLPWILVVLSTAANVVMGPLASILEGSGMFQDIALMRLLQALLANLLLWVALVAGGALYAAVVLNGTLAVFTAAWIFVRHRRFFGDLS